MKGESFAAWLRRVVPADDWYEIEERAAILEYDGGLARADAERQAMALYLRAHGITTTTTCL